MRTLTVENHPAVASNRTVAPFSFVGVDRQLSSPEIVVLSALMVDVPQLVPSPAVTVTSRVGLPCVTSVVMSSATVLTVEVPGIALPKLDTLTLSVWFQNHVEIVSLAELPSITFAADSDVNAPLGESTAVAGVSVASTGVGSDHPLAGVPPSTTDFESAYGPMHHSCSASEAAALAGRHCAPPLVSRKSK